MLTTLFSGIGLQMGKKLLFFALLLLPFALLPLLTKQKAALVLLFPVVLFHFVANASTYSGVFCAYAFPAVAAAALLAAKGAAQLRTVVKGVSLARLLPALALCIAALCTTTYAATLIDLYASSEEQAETDAARIYELLDALPDNAAVTASDSLLAALHDRTWLFSLDADPAHPTTNVIVLDLREDFSTSDTEQYGVAYYKSLGYTLRSDLSRDAFCTDEPIRPESNGHKVAIVGSGPSGLTCAGDLAKKGYEVTVYEALHTAGGVLVYGIPEFRLPKKIVAKEVETLKKLGVTIETNIVIGKTLTVDELFDMGYEAVFIGSGAGLPNFMGIPGESLNGVYSANEFLTRSNLMKSYRTNPETPIMKGGKVAVVGGGNVAMDAARTALRLGADKVYIVYRRSMEELPARREEVEHAEEEGIIFNLLCNPISIQGYQNPDDPKDPKNGFVSGITCVRMELGEPDERGRRRPIEIENSEFTMDVDTVIMSIGTSPNPLIKDTTNDLEVNRRGGIVVNEDGLTSRRFVYAGGDAVTGAATVISAMGAGKTAAQAIDNALRIK